MKDKPLILAVDRNQRNLELLGQFLGREGYQVVTATSVEDFDRALTGPVEADLVLVDIAGLDRSVWECCEQLRREGIPFLVLSPRQSTALQQESLAHGASGVLVKPLMVRELLGIIRSLLEK